MKNNIIKYLACAALALGLAATVQATSINGTINFDGTVTLNTASAGTATAVTAWMGNGGVGLPYVGSASGSFAPFVAVNDPVSIVKPWSFVSGPISAFWTVDGFTFDLTSSSIFAQGGSPATVSVTGSGTISGNGFTATTGTWAFSTQDPSAQALFTFSAAAGGQGLPDGGTTAILLGAALSALGLLRRKLA